MKQLKLYFTSDLHGYVYPTDYTDRTEKPMGMLNIVSNYKKDGNTLIIDGGDTIQGSPFMTYLSSRPLTAHPVAQVMNGGGYDYITLGNHEFNYGYDYLKSYLTSLNAKCLCANIVDKTGQLPLFSSDIKVMENGLKVGIIGFTTDFIPIWEKAHNLENFEVRDTFSSIQSIHDELKPQVDLLIGIYHGGFEYDLATHEQLSTSSENIAYKICQELAFDVLLTGHQHVPLKDHDLFGTHVVQPPHNASQYAEIIVKKDDQTASFKITSDLKPAGDTPDPTLYQALMPLQQSVQTWLDEPAGFLNQPLQPDERIQMATQGSLLANFINQIQLEVSDADLSCTSFANVVKGFNERVTVRDIVSTYVYPNTLVVLEVTGAILKEALEVCASYIHYENNELSVARRFLQPKVAHYNYDFFSNVFYTFDLTQPVGSRVVSMRVHDQEVQPHDSFSLVMNNYRASGVGGYECLRGCKVLKEIPIEMTEIIINYFMKHSHVTVDDRSFIHIIK